MNDFLKMDIFFVVATIATVVISTVLVVALVYAVRFLRTLNRIGDEVEEETLAIREDIGDVRAEARRFRFSNLFAFFGRSARRASSRKKRT